MATGKDIRSGLPSRPTVDPRSIVTLVDSRRQESLRYNSRLFQQLPSWYDLYRGVWSGRLSQFRNNISIPFLFSMLQSDVARKTQTSLGAWPIVTFEGYAPEDVAIAKKNEVLISAQMKDDDSMSKAISFFLQADMTGTAIARYGWKHISQRTRTRQNETVAPGLTIPVVREYTAERFNGPTWEPIDRLDFWQQPARLRIQDMTWVIHRYWADYDDLLDDARGPYPYFEPAAVKQLQDFPMTESAHTEWVSRKLTFRDQYDYTVRQNEKYAKPVEIWEMHGLVPSEFAPDGIRNRCIAIANGRVILKNRESAFWNGMKPFLSYSPMPDPYSFDAPGKIEICAPLQKTANRLANQKLDALDLLIDPMWVASNQVNINTNHLFTRAGRVLLVDGVDAANALTPLTPDIRGFQQAYPEISQLWQFMQLGSGINDIVMGVDQGARETARGFLGRQENVLTRLAMEAKQAEEQFLEPLANQFRALDRQFLPLPYEQKIVGSLALVNPITGLPYQGDAVRIDPDDLAPDYKARAVGATYQMGKSGRQQNFMALLQIMSSNPALMGLVNWANFARQAFELFDFKNVDELLVQQQIPLLNQMALQSGVGPEAVAGAVSQPMSQLSPNILGSLLGNQEQASPIAMAGMTQ